VSRARWLVALLIVGVVAGVFAFVMQRPARIPHIGFLGLDSQMQAGRLGAFKDGLRELGYVEGQNIVIEYRWAEGHFERLPELGLELVALKPDVLVTAAPPAIQALHQATTTIPIVMAAGNGPVELGFVASLAHPGGNITGLAFQDTDLSAKRLDLLQQTVPHLKRLAILWNGMEGRMPEESRRNVEAAARALDLDVLALEMRESADFGTGIAKAKAWGAQGLVQMSSPFITKNRKALVDGLQANALPAMCEARIFVVEGCLMTYSASFDAMFRRAADYVVRILKGANPADLPVEQPRDFEFVINLKAAQALGLTVPSELQLQANEIIR
jgi:putative ABC transport system substrate-binding protein